MTSESLGSKVVALPLLRYPDLTLVLTRGPAFGPPSVLAWVEGEKKGRPAVVVQAPSTECRVDQDEFDPEVQEVHIGSAAFLVAAVHGDQVRSALAW